MNRERKSIFITGAACGMGRATARLFAENRWFVGICDVDEEGLEAVASELGDQNCYSTVLDVTDQPAYKKALDEFDSKAGGRLDVLHNNAGIIQNVLFKIMDLADFERIIQVNLMGVVKGIQAAYPMLKKTPNSLCYITTSSSAIYGAPGLAAYTASKYALRGLTEALSIEFAIDDIRVANTLPGHVKTGMTTEEFEKSLPEKGPWRMVPASMVAEAVWNSYHDETGKLHWFVPDDLEGYYKYIVNDLEAERNGRRDRFVEVLKRFREAQKE